MSSPTGKTNFQKVQEFNRAFDMVAKEPANYLAGEFDELGRPEYNAFLHGRPHLITREPKLIRLRLDLIKEELGELQHAIAESDYIEIRDALADILYVVYGMGDVLGINMNVLVRNLIKSQVTLTPSQTFQIFERSRFYGNNDVTNGSVIGMSNWNWVQVYMELLPSMFYYCLLDVDVDSSNNIDREKLVIEMVKQLAILEELCTSSSIVGLDIERIGEILAKLITLDYSYSYFMGINADADFAIVHNSNMSKLCDTESDAIATVADYEAKYKVGNSPYDSPYYYELPEIGKWIVKNKSTGKALKNIKYQKVVFTS
jgi:predicted HAD superfamily Cof-like phosphohydrolase